MSQTIAVLGATGAQGGSVVKAMLQEKSWKVRGITRDPSKDAAKALAGQGVEVVAANIDDEKSLTKAFEGCQAVFAITNFWEHMAMGKTAQESKDIEVEQGIKIASAASKTASLKHFIWSTLPDATGTSGGKFPCPHLDSKAVVDKHIMDKLPELAKKTTFLWVGFYGSNLAYFPTTKPAMFASAGKYLWLQPSAADAIVPMAGDISVNVGVFTAGILNHPETSLPAKYAVIVTEDITFTETLKIWSQVTGQEATYVEISPESYDQLWPSWGGELAAQFKWGEDTGRWANLKKGLLGAKELGIEAKVVGYKACLESMKAQLLS